jgi:hypothetical protein
VRSNFCRPDVKGRSFGVDSWEVGSMIGPRHSLPVVRRPVLMCRAHAFDVRSTILRADDTSAGWLHHIKTIQFNININDDDNLEFER